MESLLVALDAFDEAHEFYAQEGQVRNGLSLRSYG